VELTKRFSKDGIYSNAVMPGKFASGLQKNFSREDQIKMGWIDSNGTPNPTFKNLEQGASTSIWAAVAPELDGKGGLYLEDCSISRCYPTKEEALKDFKGYLSFALDSNNAEKLWNLSEKLIANQKH
jgi:hypothetical protein